MSRTNCGNLHRFGQVLWLCAVPIAAPQLAQAQSAAKIGPFPEKATDGADLLGGWLEERFGRMVDSCTDKKWDRKVRKWSGSDPVTVVPSRLSTRFSLSKNANEVARDDRITRIYDLGSQSLPALFANVRTGMPAGPAKIDGNLLPVGPGVAALNISDMSPELRLTSPHFNGASYSAACANSISYAYGLSGGYKMPAVAVNAALTGSGSETASNSLRIVDGVFYSPFAAMWRGSYSDYSDASSSRSIRALPADAVEPLRTHVALIFWRWYTENPTQADKENGILEYFSGIAIREENQYTSKKDAEVSGEFSASLPVLSASLKGRAGYASSVDFWSKDYFLASFRDGRLRHSDSLYMKLPKPAEISTHFAGLQMLPWNGSDAITIYNNEPVAISQYIYGVTMPHCATGNWRAKAPDGTTAALRGLRLLRVAPALDTQQVPICLADFTYTPSDSDVTNGATLEFALTHAQTVTSGGASVQLRLAASPVTLKSYSRPDWRKLSQQPALPFDPLNISIPVGTAGSQPAQLRWRVEYQFDSKGAPGQPTEDSLALENVTRRCTNGEPLTVIAATPALENRAGLGRVLVVTLDAGVPAGTMVSNPAGAPTCQFSATLKYRLNLTGSPEIRTPLASAPLLYPLPLQPSDAPRP